MAMRRARTAKEKTAKKKAAPRKKRPVTARKSKKAVRRTRPKPERWGLAIAGSWDLAAFAVGALQQLRARPNCEITAVAGTGAGALIAALVAQDKWTDLHIVFSNLHARQLFAPRYPSLPGRPLTAILAAALTRTQSLYLADGGLRRILHERVDPAALMSSAIEARFVAVDMRSGETRTFSNRNGHVEELMHGLLAAASQPVLLPAVRVGYERRPYVNGLLRGWTPLPALFEAEAKVDRVLAISAHAPGADDAACSDIAGVAARTFDLLTADAGRSEVRTARLLNALLVLRDKAGPVRFATALKALDRDTRTEVERHLSKRTVPVIHLQPVARRPGTTEADFSSADSRAALAAGAAAAAEVL